MGFLNLAKPPSDFPTRGKPSLHSPSLNKDSDSALRILNRQVIYLLSVIKVHFCGGFRGALMPNEPKVQVCDARDDAMKY